MISLQQIHRFFLNLGVAALIATVTTLGVVSSNVWAATSPQLAPAQIQLASANRAEAVMKNIEGKAQEALGNITGDPKDQLVGKAKQAKSQALNAAEDVKANSSKFKGRAKSLTKKLQDKVNQARNGY